MIRFARALALPTAVLLAATTSALIQTTAAAAPGDAPGDGQKFSASIFRATHNSYSGNLADGHRGTITYQLDHGVRFVEFDIWDDGYGSVHDYRIGHDGPGDDEVDHSGSNPNSSNLRAWMSQVADWSRRHPSHAPIVLMLDLKSDLTDNYSYAAGNPAALNAEISSVLGSQRLPGTVNPSSKTIASLRGKVLPLLSGNAKTRAEYKRDQGYHPAVAVNGRGQVVEVHDSGSGYLWYWTGRYRSDGTVTWLRHGRYDTGITPAVTLNDRGDLVEVHQSENHTTLWSRVGHLNAAGEIDWSASRQYDNGVLPSVRFTSPSGHTVREIHRSQNHNQNWTWTGTVGSSRVSWRGNTTTSHPRYATSTSVSRSRRVSVSTGAYGATPAQTLRYSTPKVSRGLIRYPQVAFDEFQDGDSAELKQGAVFYAAPATHQSFIVAARKAGKVVRGWDFEVSDATSPLANYPASNEPYAANYRSLLTRNGAVS